MSRAVVLSAIFLTGGLSLWMGFANAWDTSQGAVVSRVGTPGAEIAGH